MTAALSAGLGMESGSVGEIVGAGLAVLASGLDSSSSIEAATSTAQHTDCNLQKDISSHLLKFVGAAMRMAGLQHREPNRRDNYCRCRGGCYAALCGMAAGR